MCIVHSGLKILFGSRSHSVRDLRSPDSDSRGEGSTSHVSRPSGPGYVEMGRRRESDPGDKNSREGSKDTDTGLKD